VLPPTFHVPTNIRTGTLSEYSDSLEGTATTQACA
jgi:hypothetical protein